MKYLLDTNVISELQKSNCIESVRKFVDLVGLNNLYLSTLTMGELCYGIERLPAGKRKHDLAIWLYTQIPNWFDRRIIILDTEVLFEWGKLKARTKRTLPINDSLIAAAAIYHNMILVTRNIKDFEGIDGINLLNPWDDS
ncbi:MAG: type II toxin-antitoxin system VapC family toxin [Treponema sp.]|nr:type II toxin-antitoxin system VapC family toxin [Treponema sp.]